MPARIDLPEVCFLCSPVPELICHRTPHFYVMAGLGPIVDGFCLISSADHIRSMADTPPGPLRDERNALVEMIRTKLQRRYGSCLVTEHGRVPVCRDDGSRHDEHCFHAHLLVFPGATDITDAAQAYYQTGAQFPSLGDAMEYAATHDNYLYSSPDSDRHNVLSGPLNTPRQLVRHLVAVTARDIGLADWRMHPQTSRTLEIARSLRSIFAAGSTESGC